MRFIELHKISRVVPTGASYDDTDDVGEPVARAEAQPLDPVTVQVDSIRCFYARRADRGPGTRITFKDGGGFAVSESYAEVKAAVETH